MAYKFETARLQNADEAVRFCNLIREQGVRSYLEIGSKFGGSFWWNVQAMPSGSKAVSVDLPHGDTSFKETLPHLKECVEILRKRKYDTHLIVGDSTDPAVIDQVRAHGPYDLVFIDANHTEPYVRKDWENYGKMARIVAFHDISWIPRPEPSKKMPIEVPKVWAELKNKYRHLEITTPGTRDNGIGVLWV